MNKIIYDKIINLEDLNNNELKAVRYEITAFTNLIAINNNNGCGIQDIIVTKKGCFKVVDEFEKECNRASLISGNFALAKPDCFGYRFFLTKRSYTLYKNSLLVFLYNNIEILIEYLNKKYEINLEKKDVLKSEILKDVEVTDYENIIFGQRNFKRTKDIIYLKLDNNIYKFKDNKFYKLKNKNWRLDNNDKLSRNNIFSEFGRNSSNDTNERINGIASY